VDDNVNLFPPNGHAMVYPQRVKVRLHNHLV
jgi:hypothetical protein